MGQNLVTWSLAIASSVNFSNSAVAFKFFSLDIKTGQLAATYIEPVNEGVFRCEAGRYFKMPWDVHFLPINYSYPLTLEIFL